MGAIGGGVFAALGAPLAWLLGAMITTMTVCLAGITLAVPSWLRAVMIAVLGVLLGSSVTSEIMAQAVGWLPAIGILFLLLVVCGGAAYLFFRKSLGLDPVTSYFASAPGGLSEMTIMGEHYGGSAPAISLVHVVRVMLVISTVPFYFRFVEGLTIPPLPPGAVSILSIGAWEAGLLGLCAVLGALLAQLCRLPAPYLFGPLLVSGAVHGAGLSHAAPPAELVAAAQVVLGSAIGARFSGHSIRRLAPVLMGAVVSAIIMIAIAASFAWALAPFLPQDASVLFLAFAPGGLAEMALIALSMDQDPTFVSTLHLIRILTIIAVVTPFFAWLRGNSAAR